MYTHDDTKNEIEQILKQAFSPITIEVFNDSPAHSGHAQALLHPAAGHFRVNMKSALFNGKALVIRHRMVYEKLADLMDARIHALSLSLHGTDS